MRKSPVGLFALALLPLLSGCGTEQIRAPGGARLQKPAVVWLPSPYYDPADRKPGDIDAIAIHTTEGSFNKDRPWEENQARMYAGTVRYFHHNDERKVSANFVMGPKGEITQMVAEHDVAWTTTYYNRRSFGIECAGMADRKETWTPELLDSLVDLVAYLCTNWGVKPVHPEGDAIKGPLKLYADRGYHGFDAPGIVGHYQVQTAGSEAVKVGKLGTKTDPGPYFPWKEFIERVQAKLGVARP